MAALASPPDLAQGVPLSARRDSAPNVVGPERWASIVGGGILALYGLKRPGLSGAFWGALGGGLIARGIIGRDPLKRNLLPSSIERDLAEQHGWSFAAPINRACAINKPRGEVYAFFRDFKTWPSFMDNVERVDVVDAKRSHWVIKAPAGKTVEWDSTITEETPGERFAYRSEEGGDIRNSGVVTFKDGAGGKGTEIHVAIVFEPPAGKLGRTFAALFMKDPAIQLRQDLVRLKMLMETGEISTSKAPDASPRDPKTIQPILHT